MRIGLLLIIFAQISLSANDSLLIVFSKIVGSENYSKYCSYLKTINPNVSCIDAYGTKVSEIPNLLKRADGLVLTGGPDINPKYYGREEDSLLCEVDNYRDSIEFVLLELAFKMELPIFSICRGGQILNVFLNGTLYPDIPTYFPSEVKHRCENPNDQCLHTVYINKQSMFYNWVKEDSIIVNSFHHQGVEKLGKGLRPTAISRDGLIEAYEWENLERKPFFFAVQWHPERLGIENPVSKKLAEVFLEKVMEYKSKRSQKE
ncbi:MAG: gamma-glutamyl-gamma-aminobutyrate hydrolase family protein [Ignavibacteria bacterium]|nr:gamma-glutamyl-gamma-aminobutyrate hydrolase family protein [Ignavibacteria bacterium]